MKFNRRTKKWVSPIKKLRRYPTGKFDIKKIKFAQYKIVVPTEEDKKQIQAALEYLHDLRDIDTDFIAVNQLIHEYPHDDNSDKWTNVIVSKTDYHRLHFEQHKKDEPGR